MVVFVLSVAVLNLGLGVAVAIAASREWADVRPWLATIRLPRCKPVQGKVVEQEATPPEVVPELPAQSPEPESSLQLPPGWRERLQIHHIQPTSLLEAVLHLVGVDGESQRSRWMTLEQSIRSNQDSLQSALVPLQSEIAAWSAWCGEVLQTLEQRRDELAEHLPWIEQLSDLVVKLASQLESLRASKENEQELSARKLLRELAGVFETSCALRDSAQECLACWIVEQGRLDQAPAAWLNDATTGMPNRLGIEELLAKWNKNDPVRKRVVSGALIEIDRLGKLNDRLGAKQTNQVIRAFATLVQGVVRSDRGDRTARVGPAIFVLLTDSGVAGAKSAAERIRQTVEAATFETRGEEFTLAANCAVCDFLVDDTATELLARLRSGVAEAKRGGRNRSAIDEGQGPVLFDAQPIQVRAQTLKVNE